VKEDFVATIGDDESKTLRHIEELYGAIHHRYSSSRIHAN
jgi:hypothetical protein